MLWGIRTERNGPPDWSGALEPWRPRGPPPKCESKFRTTPWLPSGSSGWIAQGEDSRGPHTRRLDILRDWSTWCNRFESRDLSTVSVGHCSQVCKLHLAGFVCSSRFDMSKDGSDIADGGKPGSVVRRVLVKQDLCIYIAEYTFW